MFLRVLRVGIHDRSAIHVVFHFTVVVTLVCKNLNSISRKRYLIKAFFRFFIRCSEVYICLVIVVRPLFRLFENDIGKLSPACLFQILRLQLDLYT